MTQPIQQQHARALSAWIRHALPEIPTTHRPSLLPTLTFLTRWSQDPQVRTMSDVESKIRDLERILSPRFLDKHPLPPVLWSQQLAQTLSQCVQCAGMSFRIHEDDGSHICTYCNTVHFQFVDSKAAHGSGYGNGINGGGGGTSSDYFRDHDHLPSSHSNNPNQRLERFITLLQPFRGQCNTSIIQPADFERIRTRLLHDRVQIPEELNPETIDLTLCALSLRSAYHQHINILLYMLGCPLPFMNQETFENFCNIFTAVEAEWISLDTVEDRTNFINYTFLGAQCSHLTHQYQFAPYFKVINDDKKLAELERLWKRICNGTGLAFISLLEYRGG